jgi:hypothetical protein
MLIKILQLKKKLILQVQDSIYNSSQIWTSKSSNACPDIKPWSCGFLGTVTPAATAFWKGVTFNKYFDPEGLIFIP